MSENTWHSVLFCQRLIIMTLSVILYQIILLSKWLQREQLAAASFVLGRHATKREASLGPLSSQLCHSYLLMCVRLCERLGLHLYTDKLEGRVTSSNILGIELVSHRLQARLPAEKRDRIVALLEKWSTKRFCLRRELKSLIGHLHHACKVDPQERTFLRRMIELLCVFRLDDHPITLNQEFRRDLSWWRELFKPGMALVSFAWPCGCPSRTSKSPQMLQAHWAMSYFYHPLVLRRLVNGAKVVIDRVQGALSQRCSRPLTEFSVGLSAGRVPMSSYISLELSPVGAFHCKLTRWWILHVLKFISSTRRQIRFAWAVITLPSFVWAWLKEIYYSNLFHFISLCITANKYSGGITIIFRRHNSYEMAARFAIPVNSRMNWFTRSRINSRLDDH